MIASIGAACHRNIAEEARRTLGPVMDRLGGGPFALQQAVERIERCAAIHDRTEAGIQAWLVARAPAGPGVAGR
jgi:hypothetical protein